MSTEAHTNSTSLISRLRRSVAVRLTLTYTLLSTLGLAAIFALLYWQLGRQLEQREQDLLRLQLQDYIADYNRMGLGFLALRFSGQIAPRDKQLFVKTVAPNGIEQVHNVPDDWIDRDGKNVTVPDGWGGWTVRQEFSWRVPHDQQKDFIGAAAVLPGGMLLQIARTTDNRTTLLQPLRRTFIWVAVAVVIVSFLISWLAARRADVGLTTCDVAELLKTQPANVRRLLAVGALYAAGRAARAEHVFPTWQFTQPRPLPHLSEVLAALPPATHPLEVEAFMTSPREALGGRSPVEWLSTGGDAAVVVDLADEENWV